MPPPPRLCLAPGPHAALLFRFHDSEVKLIDFGVSQVVGPSQTLHAEVGSPSYMAPEVFSGCYTAACDLWSLGVVLFVMLFGFNA